MGEFVAFIFVFWTEIVLPLCVYLLLALIAVIAATTFSWDWVVAYGMIAFAFYSRGHVYTALRNPVDRRRRIKLGLASCICGVAGFVIVDKWFPALYAKESNWVSALVALSSLGLFAAALVLKDRFFEPAKRS